MFSCVPSCQNSTRELNLRNEYKQSETEIAVIFQFSQGQRKESLTHDHLPYQQTAFPPSALSRVAITSTASMLIIQFTLTRVLYCLLTIPIDFQTAASMPSCRAINGRLKSGKPCSFYCMRSYARDLNEYRMMSCVNESEFRRFFCFVSVFLTSDSLIQLNLPILPISLKRIPIPANYVCFHRIHS